MEGETIQGFCIEFGRIFLQFKAFTTVWHSLFGGVESRKTIPKYAHGRDISYSLSGSPKYHGRNISLSLSGSPKYAHGRNNYLTFAIWFLMYYCSISQLTQNKFKPF